jgi:hypothetical protein
MVRLNISKRTRSRASMKYRGLLCIILLAGATFFLQSCINDGVLDSSNTQSTEASKSSLLKTGGVFEHGSFINSIQDSLILKPLINLSRRVKDNEQQYRNQLTSSSDEVNSVGQSHNKLMTYLFAVNNSYVQRKGRKLEAGSKEFFDEVAGYLVESTVKDIPIPANKKEQCKKEISKAFEKYDKDMRRLDTASMTLKQRLATHNKLGVDAQQYFGRMILAAAAFDGGQGKISLGETLTYFNDLEVQLNTNSKVTSEEKVKVLKFLSIAKNSAVYWDALRKSLSQSSQSSSAGGNVYDGLYFTPTDYFSISAAGEKEKVPSPPKPKIYYLDGVTVTAIQSGGVVPIFSNFMGISYISSISGGTGLSHNQTQAAIAYFTNQHSLRFQHAVVADLQSAANGLDELIVVRAQDMIQQALANLVSGGGGALELVKTALDVALTEPLVVRAVLDSWDAWQAMAPLP